MDVSTKIKNKYNKIYTHEEIEQFKSKAIENLRNDTEVYQEIKKMGAKTSHVNEYLSFFLDFQEDFNYCKNCPGYDKCEKVPCHLKLNLIIDNEFVERKYTMCEVAAIREQINNKYLICDVPETWKSARFQQIKPLKSRQQILDSCIKVLNGKDRKWLYVSGNPSSGKSYILVALVNELVQSKNEGPVAVIDCATRIKELNDLSFSDKNGFQELFNQLNEVPILLLDNFGAEYKNDYIRDTIIYPLLSYRKKNNLLTLFSSNFTLEDIQTLYSTKGKMSELMAKQLVTLIRDSSKEPISLISKSVFKIGD